MYDNLMNIADRKVFFNVYEEPIKSTVTGSDMLGYKALIGRRGNEQWPMSVVKSTYRVVENEEILTPLHNQMIKYFDQSVTEEIEIIDRVAKNGNVCLSEYVLPRINGIVETETGHKTKIGLRFILKNTFNGSGSITLYGGAIDFFCTNGLIRGEYDITSRKHTKNFSIDGFVRAFDDCMMRFNETVTMYQRYADTKLTNTAKVQQLFEKLVSPQKLEEAKRKNTLSDRLFAQFTDEVRNRGSNMYSVISALTHYASHDDERFALRSNSDEDSLHKRQEQVTKWLSSNAWKEFSLAA